MRGNWKALDRTGLLQITAIECSLDLKSGEPLDPPSTATIQLAEQFMAREHFKEDITPAADVKISWLGASFVRRFAVKVEAAGVTSLQAYLLRSPSNDRDIIAELGNRHETSLADVWCFLRQQAKGEGGALQTNSVNIFFVRDGAGELGVVDTVWGGAGWEVGASPVGRQTDVVSRDAGHFPLEHSSLAQVSELPGAKNSARRVGPRPSPRRGSRSSCAAPSPFERCSRVTDQMPQDDSSHTIRSCCTWLTPCLSWSGLLP